jgi:hypothetical protein
VIAEIGRANKGRRNGQLRNHVRHSKTPGVNTKGTMVERRSRRKRMPEAAPPEIFSASS